MNCNICTIGLPGVMETFADGTIMDIEAGWDILFELL